jgi:hypothetical protein
MNHRDKLKPLRPQSSGIRALTLLLEERRQIVDEQRRLTNRLISNLKQYYPPAHEWFENKGTTLFCEFMARWPTLKQLRQARHKSCWQKKPAWAGLLDG